mmetsp:Transcript_83908/g.213606  ORF Transcript_83908/g.213606 Transcript_83908/m.213606 type:complete len:235 (+) Transcript_83908:1564-2268(+)
MDEEDLCLNGRRLLLAPRRLDDAPLHDLAALAVHGEVESGSLRLRHRQRRQLPQREGQPLPAGHQQLRRAGTRRLEAHDEASGVGAALHIDHLAHLEVAQFHDRLGPLRGEPQLVQSDLKLGRDVRRQDHGNGVLVPRRDIGVVQCHHVASISIPFPSDDLDIVADFEKLAQGRDGQLQVLIYADIEWPYGDRPRLEDGLHHAAPEVPQLAMVHNDYVALDERLRRRRRLRRNE